MKEEDFDYSFEYELSKRWYHRAVEFAEACVGIAVSIPLVVIYRAKELLVGTRNKTSKLEQNLK